MCQATLCLSEFSHHSAKHLAIGDARPETPPREAEDILPSLTSALDEDTVSGAVYEYYPGTFDKLPLFDELSASDCGLAAGFSLDDL